MKKSVINMVIGAIIGIGISVCVMLAVVLVNDIKETKELIAESEELIEKSEETNELSEILVDYGTEACNAYMAVDKEFKYYGGIGEYKFYYLNDVFRLDATSVDGTNSISTPVSYYN